MVWAGNKHKIPIRIHKKTVVQDLEMLLYPLVKPKGQAQWCIL